MINPISLSSNLMMSHQAQNNNSEGQPATHAMRSSGVRPVTYTTIDGGMFIGFYLSVRG